MTASASPSLSSAESGVAASSAGPDAAAIAVYLAMWADMVEAAKTADYQSPRLSDHAASQALLLLTGSLRKAHEQNVVIKGDPALSPRVIGVTPATHPVAVSILDCIDDSRWLNYTRDGELQNGTPGGKHRTTATVGFLDDRWMVTQLQIGEVGSCS